MKGYFSSLLGSLTALAIFGVWGIIALFVLMGIFASLSEKPAVEVQDGSVLVLNLNTTIQDAPPSSSFEQAVQESLGGRPQSATYLLKVINTIEHAAGDDSIAALLLHGNLQQEGYGSGLALVSEIRQSLEAFQASGKQVHAYLVNPSQKDYYLASIANEIWINPFGLISLQGLASNAPFLGDTLEKYGIGVQTTRVGTYKSAVELFTRNRMSEADREQKTALLSDLWTSLLVETSRARELSVEQLETLSAQQAFFTAEKAQSAHLIDRVGYLDELIDDLATRYQASAKKHSFRQIDFERNNFV